MADISPEGIKQSYKIACDLYSKKQYGECRKLLKVCIQVSSFWFCFSTFLEETWVVIIYFPSPTLNI